MHPLHRHVYLRVMVWGGHGAMPPPAGRTVLHMSWLLAVVQADVPKRVYSKLNMVEIFTQGGGHGGRGQMWIPAPAC